MKKADLRVMFDQANVRPDMYSLDGRLKNDAFIMEEVYGKWKVYYFERGERSMIREFDSENDACLYLLKTLGGEPSASE